MIKKVLVGFGVLILGFVILASMQPAEFRVTRSSSFAVPPAKVFAQINNLHNWNAWSPWAKLDPNAKNTFEGPASGVGASMSWSGNKDVGEGRMTITESQANKRIQMKLEFVKPFAGTSTTDFTFQPEGKNTKVDWKMTGQNQFIGKAISLVMDCDKMVGGQFEQGFANLHALLER